MTRGEVLIHRIALLGIATIRALPLTWVARLGSWIGRLVGRLDARHRRVARQNLEAVFGHELSKRTIRRLVSLHFSRIGENFACAIRAAGMSHKEIGRILELEGFEKLVAKGTNHPHPPPSRIVAIGHFGNFELFASAGGYVPGYRCATTYRALRHPVANRLMQDLRQRSGCIFFERRRDGEALRMALANGGILLGILADQHAGRHGVWGQFLGRPCSTTPAPAVLALRYRCPLFTAICYRTGLARWRIQLGDEIPTRCDGRRRPVADITADINREFETAIRRDPVNWFWVHDRWKKRRRLKTQPLPPAA